jgi:hypothetical protein
MVVLEADEVYGVLLEDFQITRHYSRVTKFMLIYSFISCSVVRRTQLAIALTAFAAFHACLILTETSTLDVLRGDRKRSLVVDNWLRVFGRRPLGWCLPVAIRSLGKL